MQPLPNPRYSLRSYIDATGTSPVRNIPGYQLQLKVYANKLDLLVSLADSSLVVYGLPLWFAKGQALDGSEFS